MGKAASPYPTPTHSADSPAQVCLCCGYSLAGLPAEHICPECGFPHDPTAFAVDAGEEPKWLLVLVHTALVGVLIVILLRTNRMLEWVIFGLLLTSEIVHALWARRQTRPRLIVDRRGLHRVRASSLQKSVPWPQVAGFKNSRVDGALLVQLQGGGSLRICRDPKLAKGCRSDIERAWRESVDQTG